MAIDPPSTGLDSWQLVGTEDINPHRRRLTYKLTDGRVRSVVIVAADDSNDMRRKIGDAFEADTRRLIRGGETVEG